MSSLSQALRLGDMPSQYSAFQEHAAHSIEWSMALSSKGSSGTCIPEVLRHSSILLSRRSAGCRYTAVFFVCDEFQEIVSANRDGLSDLNFWDKARSTRTIGIIAAQAVSSFYAALGERDVADALLQNFRHTLCFRTEDAHTIDRLHRLIGQVDVA